MMSHVVDGPINYIVLKREDNTITIPFMEEFLRILDAIESQEGPGVLVTIGTGSRIFSTGFDMKTWIKEPETMIPS